MARLSVHLFGPFQVTMDGKAVEGFESDKVRALLAYLTAEPGRPVRREMLAGLLWPDYPEETARANLRYALANLRQALGDQSAEQPFLLVDRQTVQLNPVADVWVDVTAAKGLVAANQQLIEQMEEAVALYRGDLLEGFSLPSSALFEEWVLLRREQLRRQVLSSLHLLAAHYEAQGNYERAARYAWRQVELDPWREEAQRELMRLLALDGQRAAALAQYEACRQALASELGVEPAAETTRLYERIRDGREKPGQPRGFGPPMPPPSPTPGVPTEKTPIRIPKPSAGHRRASRRMDLWGRPVVLGVALLGIVALLFFLARTFLPPQNRPAKSFWETIPTPPALTLAGLPLKGLDVGSCASQNLQAICLHDLWLGTETEISHNLPVQAFQGFSWSPDGKKIVFAGSESGTPPFYLYFIDVDGSNLSPLSPGSLVGMFPVWSPDGQWIAFLRDGVLWLIRPDGSDATQVAEVSSAPGPFTAAGWSPDSQQIAFLKIQPGTEDYVSEIWVTGVDLTSPRLVQSFPGRANGELAWSPDGQQIICACHIETRTGSPRDVALLFNADGSGEAQLADHSPIFWFAHYWPQWGNP